MARTCKNTTEKYAARDSNSAEATAHVPRRTNAGPERRTFAAATSAE
ncbi:MAG: hypothetical protein ACKORY_05440 [Actinomycetota bacterium]